MTQPDEDRRGDGIHIRSDDVRAGSTPHILRFVLAISLALAILFTSVIWITGAIQSSQ